MKKIILSIIIILAIVTNIFFINTINAENAQADVEVISEVCPLTIDEIVTRVERFSNTSEDEKKFITKEFNTDEEIFIELENNGYLLIESINLMKTIIALDINEAATMRLLKEYKDNSELNEAISEITCFRDTYKVSESDMKIVYDLYLEGYKLHDIFYYYVISSGIGERFDILIKTEVLDESAQDTSKKEYDEASSMNPFDIIQRYSSIKEATDEEKKIILNKFNITENEIIECETNGYSLSESINIASIMKRYSLTFEELEQLSVYYENPIEIEKVLDGVKSISKDLKNIDKKLINQMLGEGYKLKDISRAYLVSEAFDIDIRKIIKKDNNDNEKVIKNNMQDEEYELLLDLEDKYSVDAMEILEYMSKEKVSLKEVYKVIVYYEYSKRGLAAHKSENNKNSDNLEQSLTTTLDIPVDNLINYDKYLTAPFKISDFNKESINTNMGDLNYNYSALNLPGRNGLDLNIAASYDSSKSGLYDMSYSGTVHYIYKYKLTIKGLSYRYFPWLLFPCVRDIEDEAYDTPEQVLYFNTEQEAYDYAASFTVPSDIPYSESQEFSDIHDNTLYTIGKYDPWEVISTTQSSPAPSSKTVSTSDGYNGSIPRVEPTDTIYDSGVINGTVGTDGRLTWSRTQTFRANYNGMLTKYWYRKWLRGITLEYALYDSYVSYYNTTSPNTYTELHNNIGAGWSLNFSNIENMSDGSKYLHLGNGNSYKINITSIVGDSNLDKYLLKDIRLETDNGTYSNGQKTSSYVLIYKNGNKEYFANDGRLLGIKDRYDNTIKFEHDTTINNHPLITKITDTLDRITTIGYQNTATGKEITITAPGEKVTRLIIEPAVGYAGDYILKKIIDPENRETVFDYNYQTGISNFTSKLLSGPNNVYVNLKEVKYPTNGFSRYTYQKTVGNLGNKGVYEYYRIETREDVDNASSYNKNTYSYNNNYTGYGIYNDPNNLPDTFFYSTTITDVKGNSKTYTYNNKHLAVKDEAREGTTILQKNDYTYYLDRLVTSNISTTYNKLGGSRITQQDWSYNDYGDLLKYTDANRYETNYQYDSTFHLTSSISKVLDDTGLTMYTYNDINPANGNINYTRQQHIVNGVNEDITTTFTYDSYGNITDEVTTQIDENTIQQHYDYDVLYKNAYLTKKTATVTDYKGVQKTVEEAYEYDYNTGELLKHTNANNKVTQFQYDKLGRKKLVINPDVTKQDNTIESTSVSIVYDDTNNKVTLTDENGHQLRVSYDTLGREITEEELNNGEWVILGQTKYNMLGQVDYVIDANNNKTTNQYDSFGRTIRTDYADLSYSEVEYNDAFSTNSSLKTTYDEERNRHDYYYDNLGNLVKEVSYPDKADLSKQSITQYHYNTVGKADYTIDANNNRTNYKYDDLNRLITVINAKLESTEYDYDVLGNVKSIKDSKGSITNKKYDELGRLIEQTNQLNQKENWEYDNVGNLLTYIDKMAQTTTYTYNEKNLLESAATGSKSTSYDYDKAGNIKAETDASGTVAYEYYDNGKLKKEIQPDGKYIYYEYDYQGNRTKMLDHFGKQTAYTYDSRNRLNTVTVDGTTTSYTYYPNSNRASITYPGGTKEEYTYNGNNALISLVNKKADGTDISRYTYTYDNVGNQLSKTENGNVTTYIYDNLNRISTAKEPDGKVNLYSYDKNGNILRKTEEKTVDYNIISTTNTYTYDACNKLTQKLQQNSIRPLISPVIITPSTAYVNAGDTVTFTVSAKYDNKEVVPDSVLANTQWECRSPYFSFGTNTIGKTVTGVCTYDGGGYYISDPETSTLLQDSETSKNKNESTTNKAVEQSLIIYPPSGYTAVPITATINGSIGKATVYVYLGTTTLSSFNPPLTTNVTLSSSEKTSTSTTTTLTTTGDITTTYTYDMNGNLIQEKQQEGTTIKTESFQYNELNQMIAYTSPTGSTTTYSYSPSGLRKSKTTDTTTTGYYLDGDNVILETTNGSLSARNIRGINQLARQDNTGTTMYYMYNGHGDVMHLVDSMGTIKNTYDYDIYGKEKTASEGELTNPIRYSGEYYDSESGMYYLRARYYDPEIARFISEDSYEGNNQDPLSLNLYTYCRNNPITRIDPSGNADLTIFNGATGDGGGGVIVVVGGAVYILYEGATLVGEKAAEVWINKAVQKEEGETIKADRSFEEKLKDINENPEDWEKSDESVKDSTKKGNKSGKSIESEYTNKKTGEKIYKHTLTDANGKPIEVPHYRPFPKQL